MEVEIDPIVDPHPQGMGVFVWALTLLGTRLGGGIVGVPISAKNTGYVLISTFQCIYIWMCMFSVWMLMRTREITGRASYSSIGMHLIGNWSLYFINSVIALAQLGFPIIFFIVFGDVAESLIKRIDENASSVWYSRWLTHSFLALWMLYLILKKDIQQLKYASILLFFGIVVFVVLMFVHYLVSDPDPNPKQSLTETTPNIKFFASVPTIIASYSIHPSLFPAFASLKHKTSKNGIVSGTMAIWVAFIVYLITPLLAFGLYGEDVESNLLKNLSEESGALPIVLEILFLIIAIMHIPIIFFVGKEAVLIIFDEATRRSYSNPPEFRNKHPVNEDKDEASLPRQGSTPEEGSERVPDEEDNKEEESKSEHAQHVEVVPQPESVLVVNPKEYLNMKNLYYYLVVMTWFVIVVILSIVVGDVSVFFGLIGSTSGWFNIIAGPSTFYIFAIHRYKVELFDWKQKASYILAILFMVIGYIAIISLNTWVIINAIE